MIETVGDIWDFHERGYFVGITTNGVVTKDGRLVMGRGVALQARERFRCHCGRPDCKQVNLDKWLGAMVQEFGNIPHFVRSDRLFTFPTKYHFREKSDLKLIETSAKWLMWSLDLPEVQEWTQGMPVILPRPGCANGGLTWGAVEKVLEPILDDRVHIVSLPSEVGL